MNFIIHETCLASSLIKMTIEVLHHTATLPMQQISNPIQFTMIDIFEDSQKL